MKDEQRFDAIIVGAGQAGPPLAGRLTFAGWKVALVERKLFGGTCVNTGCTPTKTLVASAAVAHTTRRAAKYGVNAGPVSIDFSQVKARMRAVVERSRSGVEGSLKDMAGCTVFEGTAHFESAKTMRVGDALLRADHIFLNVGARPSIPKFPGLGEVSPLTSTTLLELDTLPEHLVVVGGSYVGLEFAQMYRRFGSEVTVVERGARLLGRVDEDVAAAVRTMLEGEGIRIRTGANCIRLEGHGEGRVAVHLECGEDESPEAEGSHVLLAVGREPNTSDLNLEAAGLIPDAKGFVPVDDELRTAVPGIWALGDCNGRGAFTHTSFNDSEIVAANLLQSEGRRVSDRVVMHALYTDPPLAQVGMTEREVRETGRPALMGVRPMSKVSRAIEKGETTGLIKVLVDAESRKILGATIFGVGGDEAIHCVATAMYAGGTDALMTHSMHIHPTVAELIPTIFGELKPLE